MRNRKTTEYVVLGVLMTGDMHGYDIRKFLSENLEGIWHVSTSQLYALIRKLEDKALVTASISSGDNQIPRKVLTITREGEKRFTDWIISPTQHVRELRMEFLTKLFFLRHLNLQGIDALLEAQVALLTKLKEKVEYDWGRQNDAFGKVVLGFKRAQFEMCLDWLNSDVAGFIGKIGTNGLTQK